MIDGGYRHDMAYVHLMGHSGFVEAALPAILRQLRDADIRTGRVLDLGCGPGVLAADLTRAGYQVVGIDLSADMVSLAQRTAPDATFVHGSFLDVDMPSCSAVVALGQSLGYALDPRVDAAALPVLFQRIRTALRPGGLLLFDLNAPPAGGPEAYEPVRHHRVTDDWVLLADAAYDAALTTLTRQITLFRRIGDAFRRTDERHLVHLHEPAKVLRQLAAAGFQARRLDGYGPAMTFPADLAAYAAVRL
jgi:SAM-dependent methyltransferase